MKNIILIHGYNGIPKIYQWLKVELEKEDYKVIIPEFPSKEGVIYHNWNRVLEKDKIDFNKDTIVIAHSIGNEFIIKHFMENNLKIKAYISLAGFAKLFEVEGKEDLNRAIKEFLVDQEEIENFKECIPQKFSIYSDNDYIVPFKVLEAYPKILEAEPIFIKGIGHMGSKSGIESIPELLEIIKRIK